MLRVKRIITDNAFSYEDVEFMDFAEDHRSHGIGKYITDKSLNQIVIRTKEGETKILTDWMVGVIEMRVMKPRAEFEKIKKIVINGEISYGPAYLIPLHEYGNNKIPSIFKYQLSFVANRLLYICHQEAIIEITL